MIEHRVVRLCFVLILATVALACGPQPPVRTVVAIDGMHCDGCEEAITQAVAALPGVVEVTADHERGEAIVVYRPNEVSEEEITSTIEDLAYTVAGTKTEAVVAG